MAAMTNEQKKAGVLPLEEDELDQAAGGAPPSVLQGGPPPPPKGVV